ncbi:MAG: hypothetical protein IJ877_02480 [Candidatus Gastranaerophilales bacterium]|nr:hypothetical protein [Candidatus Gastranaerophilales bacterium]
MKKISFILLSILVLPCFGYEDMPILPQESGFNLQFNEAEQETIDVEGMKKADKIKEVQKEAFSNKSPKFKVDLKQVNHQRALDFTTKQTNSTLLPRF